MDYGLITRQQAVKEMSSTILRSAEWGKRLGAYKVAYTGAFRGGAPEKKKVGGALLRCKELDVDTVVQYCW